jgi:subtilase family serine protease
MANTTRGGVVALSVVALSIACRQEPTKGVPDASGSAATRAEGSGSANAPERLAPATPVDMVLGLPTRDESQLDALLKELYDPASPRFRQFLEPAQYAERFGPNAATYDALVAYAKAQGFEVVSTAPTHKTIHVRAPASAVEKAFAVTLNRVRDPVSGKTVHAADHAPSLAGAPAGLQVTGLDGHQVAFRAPNMHGKGPPPPPNAGGSGAGGAFTGKDFRKAYAPRVTLTGKGQVVGVIQFDGYDSSDIQSYEKANGLRNVPIQNVYLDGYTGTATNTESPSDIELVLSMAPGISKVVVYGGNYSSGVHDVLSEIANPTQHEQLPAQITTSYFFFYDKNVYDVLKQLSVQGQALFVASGDWGSYNETNGGGDHPPADHPLVTSVGATNLTTTPGGAWSAESVAFFSGGGYSPWAPNDPQFDIPSWQVGMDLTAAKGSTVARNAPDVAIVGTNISLFFGGASNGFAGTSASAPLWAGFLALANERAASLGRPSIGFANPAIYAAGRGKGYAVDFHDITVGDNFNGTNPALYSAVAGFDLCSGFGSPNGQPLIDALACGSSGCNCGLAHQPCCGNTTCYEGLICNGTCQSPATLCVECDQSLARCKASCAGDASCECLCENSACGCRIGHGCGHCFLREC